MRGSQVSQTVTTKVFSYTPLWFQSSMGQIPRRSAAKTKSLQSKSLGLGADPIPYPVRLRRGS
ncbi:MAG: hypothetical protein BJG00_012350 [Limnothrix sp. CACIAM 69d]|nr:MAG: hypothetical protein BJG00_012350 [Limnothrix sp. CACIAM 69d]